MTPRKNVTEYCSFTRSPLDASRVSILVTTVVPEPFAWMPTGAPRDSSSVPGTIGWWKCMSCSPWTTVGIASAGVTRPTVSIITSHTGTTAKIGGASSPPTCSGMGSLVAAAYAFVRSASTLKGLSSVH